MRNLIINEAITLTDQGILVNEKPTLPIIIKEVVLCYNYSTDTMSPTITCNYTIENVSLGVHNRFHCSYSPGKPLASLKELKNNGIVFKDKPMALAILAAVYKYFFRNSPALTKQSDPPVKRFFISDHAGWIYARKQWVYLTSEFGITKDGIDKHWYCTTQNAYLYYDPKLSAKDAYIQLLKALNLDFSSAAPILASSILSLLKPMQNKMNLYPIPGLLISGPTSCGKTELATGLTHILTNKSGLLSDIFILQNSSRNLDRAINNLSDSTIILDDIRRSPSYSLREKISAALDSFIRTCFSSDSKKFLLPVITGENGTLDHMPLSLRNRIIEVPLDTDSDSIRNRQELIATFHESALLVRTFFRHFIQYLANCFSCETSFPSVAQLKEDFSKILPTPEQKSRGYDNLFLSYIAFDILLKYSKHQNVANKIPINDPIQAFLKTNDFKGKYITVLKNIYQRQNMLDPKSQATCLLLSLLRNIRIYRAFTQDQASYRDSNSPYIIFRCYNEYGHHAILDLTQGYSGIYIDDTRSLAQYPRGKASRTVLILHYEMFFDMFSDYSEICQSVGQSLPYRSFNHFLANLRDQHILLGKSRHDPEYPNRIHYKTTNYPCYEADDNDRKQPGKTSILVFKLEGQLRKDIDSLCDYNYLFPRKDEFKYNDIKACTKILQSLV